jgi:hypothetical protein
VVHLCHLSDGRKFKVGSTQSKPVQTKNKQTNKTQDPIAKITRTKRTEGLAQTPVPKKEKR